MDLLNSAAKPYYGFDKLEPGTFFEVIKFKMVKNRFYKPKNDNSGVPMCLVVELHDQILYLPEHISRQFEGNNSKKIEKLNNDGVKKFMYFGGISEKK